MVCTTWKKEHEDDSQSEIIQTCKISLGNLHTRLIRADIIDIHPCNDLHTFKIEHEDEDYSESEIIQAL